MTQLQDKNERIYHPNSPCDCIVAGTILGAVGLLISILCGVYSFIFIIDAIYGGATEFALGIIAISGEF